MTTTSPTLTASDVRTVFAKAMATGGDVIASVRPDQLDGPTPCTEYDVRTLVGHLVGVLDRVALMGRGENPFESPDTVTGVADDAWLAAWSDAAQRVEEAWADDASLERIVHLPWAQESGALTLASYTNEITVHTWDLATAIGRRPAWDHEVVAGGPGGARRAPERARRAPLGAGVLHPSRGTRLKSRCRPTDD